MRRSAACWPTRSCSSTSTATSSRTSSGCGCSRRSIAARPSSANGRATTPRSSPGEHFLSARPESLRQVTEDLLRRRAATARDADAALELIRERLPMRDAALAARRRRRAAGTPPAAPQRPRGARAAGAERPGTDSRHRPAHPCATARATRDGGPAINEERPTGDDREATPGAVASSMRPRTGAEPSDVEIDARSDAWEGAGARVTRRHRRSTTTPTHIERGAGLGRGQGSTRLWSWSSSTTARPTTPAAVRALDRAPPDVAGAAAAPPGQPRPAGDAATRRSRTPAASYVLSSTPTTSSTRTAWSAWSKPSTPTPGRLRLRDPRAVRHAPARSG